jgi:hypothetical protein
VQSLIAHFELLYSVNLIAEVCINDGLCNEQVLCLDVFMSIKFSIQAVDKVFSNIAYNHVDSRNTLINPTFLRNVRLKVCYVGQFFVMIQ